MKAVVVYEPGGVEQLKVEERPRPNVRPGWSLVKIKGFGINRSEIFTREGKSPTVHFPRILGIECVGEVAETTDPSNLPVGQVVISIMGEMGRDFDGGYSEYVLLPNHQIYTVQGEWDWQTLATIPETSYTAYGSLKQLRIKDGDRILVRGATSGVGVTFGKLVKAGFNNIVLSGSTRSLNKKMQLQEVGFDLVIEDKDGVLQTDQAYDKILDLIGPFSLRDSLKHVAKEGILCVTGLLGGEWTIDQFDPINDLFDQTYLTGFDSAYVTQEKLDEMFHYIKENHVSIHPEKVFSLDQIQQAHQYLQSQESFGKVIVMNK